MKRLMNNVPSPCLATHLSILCAFLFESTLRTNGCPSLRANKKARKAPNMAPIQVMTTPQTDPKIIPFAMATNSAGKGRNEWRIIIPIEAKTPQ